MSKIAGFVTDLPAAEAKAQLSSMVGAMMHEPFYTTGTHCLPHLGCYVGWVDPLGGDEKTRVYHHDGRILIFVGEHFGSSPNNRADGAELLTRYAREGERCFRQLNGWFAGLLIDPVRDVMVLFNDRLAMHRVHYATTKSGFAFASEAKSLLTVRAESRNIDPHGLGEFFALGTQISERTLFHDISRLPAGSAWTIDRALRVRKHTYFTPDEIENQPSLDAETYYARLKGTLTEIVPRYLSHETPVAVSLTGGFDTRAIMAFADRSAHPRLSYTYGGMYRDCFDVTIARDVARVCGYEHEVLNINAPFLSQFPEYAEKTVRVTDGALDIGVAHEVYLSALARKISPVRLTGNYGSEVLRGVSTFRPLKLPRQMFAAEFVPYVEAAERAFESVKNQHSASFVIFHEIPFGLYGRLAAAQSQLTIRSPFLDNDLVSLAYQAPPGHSVTDCWTRLIRERDPLLASVPTDRGQLGAASVMTSPLGRLYNHLLFKSEWYYEGGMPNWLSRVDAQFTRGRKPPFFAGTHKIQHYRLWFRDQLADYVDSMLNDSTAASRSYLNRSYVRDIAAAHRSGRRNCTAEISALTTAELIHRVFIDRQQRSALEPARAPELASLSQWVAR
jgi:asparagine synthase (glutamine-hydrolysing)